ncbi:Glucan endo-1,3-beta-glucosidase A1 precursor [Legionella beliardensis]|uniref:Glucan endo-1,3-beta-glucosidase A1 n=1 Tax=Legionella beliardensis TaxID=91822 RepID=A0A378I1R4_9GAMM|nr:glycoside hydrolase family 16 protein [Legionella beliardensis]STX28892.1 Glucan endo-1,3-beta-glucosidase A1 precursor [Legionella beliardensis]
MKKKWILPSILLSQVIIAAPCPFDQAKNCELKTDILKDKSPEGLNYYAPTNYDHRMSGEINVYDAGKVVKKTDGALTLLADIVNPGFWRSGEIMTRANLTSPPYNAPTPSAIWTTKVMTHGYLEVNVRLPYCTASADGRCQNGSNPADYNRGLWPAIWMMPTYDNEWPLNGEIDIMEAYPKDTAFNVTTAALHFNGNDPRCGGNDCRGWGYGLGNRTFPELAYRQPHTWGYEWEKDPQSPNGGYIMTGYIDNTRVWGPLRTDTLPADGPNALRRGFNDPNGGFYLIVNLAVGGPYAGAPNPQLQKASMDVNSIKVYQVGGGKPTEQCIAPVNITSSQTDDMRSVTLKWNQPQNSAPIQLYRVKDWQKRLLWEGSLLTFTDKTLPGQPGKYTYFLSSMCANQESPDVQYDANVAENICNPPGNITTTYSADKKSVTLKWVTPSSGSPATTFEVRDWMKRVLWKGAGLTWTDKTLPGNSGKFTYFLNSVCQNQKSSTMVQKDVLIP